MGDRESAVNCGGQCRYEEWRRSEMRSVRPMRRVLRALLTTGLTLGVIAGLGFGAQKVDLRGAAKAAKEEVRRSRLPVWCAVFRARCAEGAGAGQWAASEWRMPRWVARRMTAMGCKFRGHHHVASAVAKCSVRTWGKLARGLRKPQLSDGLHAFS